MCQSEMHPPTHPLTLRFVIAMHVSESFAMALAALNANKLRSALTMVGIVIGNASVITMVGIGQGVQKLADDEFKSLGPNVVFVIPGTEDNRRVSFEVPQTLTLEDAIAIDQQVPSVTEVAPQVSSVGTIIYRSNNTSSQLFGVTPDYLSVRSFEIAQGRFITATDVQRNERVAVVGCDLTDKLLQEFQLKTTLDQDNDRQSRGNVKAQEIGICDKLTNNQPLLPSETLVGQQIRVKNLSFLVVGMTRPKGAFAGTNLDDVVFMPLTTVANRLVGKTNLGAGTEVTVISMTAKPGQTQAAKFQVTNLLRRRHGITTKDDFEIRTQEDIMRTIGNITSGLTLMLAAIASISLVVGGIGIMNIMLVSVSERTQEIGLRKALGASQGDILMQFLIEAVIVSAIGGVLGTTLGMGGVALLGVTTPLKAGVSLTAIGVAVSVSGTIGLFFGVFPARQASRLDPIVALRSM